MATWKDWTPPEIKESIAEYSWNTDYAADVHELKGDRWTDRGLAGSDLPAHFQSAYNGDLQQTFKETAEYLGDRFQAEVPVSTGHLQDSYQIKFSSP